MMERALAGTKVRHYHGIDLSQPALDLAAVNLADAPFEVDLDHCDFVEAIMRRPEHADAAWCSLSLHHLSTDDKLSLMTATRHSAGPGGLSCSHLRVGRTRIGPRYSTASCERPSPCGRC